MRGITKGTVLGKWHYGGKCWDIEVGDRDYALGDNILIRKLSRGFVQV